MSRWQIERLPEGIGELTKIAHCQVHPRSTGGVTEAWSGARIGGPDELDAFALSAPVPAASSMELPMSASITLKTRRGRDAATEKRRRRSRPRQNGTDLPGDKTGERRFQTGRSLTRIRVHDVARVARRIDDIGDL